MKKIKDNPTFIKDEKSGGVVNYDNDGYQMAKIRKAKIKEDTQLKKRVSELEKHIKTLEKIIFDNINIKNN